MDSAREKFSRIQSSLRLFSMRLFQTVTAARLLPFPALALLALPLPLPLWPSSASLPFCPSALCSSAPTPFIDSNLDIAEQNTFDTRQENTVY